MFENKLGQETSPYLRQHKNNPVAWYPWGDEAFNLAKAQNKPILLSIGYSACHWCHVMAHESFENKEISGLMNEHFINIKVDREERPDIDDMYQTALSIMGQHGGWPLTVALTPNLEPFWGGTYVPPTPRHGMTGFADLLASLATVWINQTTDIQNNIYHLKKSFAHLNNQQNHNQINGHTLTPYILDQVGEQLLSFGDSVYGGFQGAPKFPQVPILQYLWQAWQRTEHKPYFDHVTLTLKRMGDGGIYDHIGGGFARYATDEIWLVPHFEKMLYDNALLIQIMSDVYLETHDQTLKAKVYETINWVFREMKINAPDSTFAFATALDADSPSATDKRNKEGQFYIWNAAEIDQLLGQQSEAFKAHYNVTAQGNWSEGAFDLSAPVNILNVESFQQNNQGDDPFKSAREILYRHRQKRPAPGQDHKVLCDVNALFIIGLVKAGLSFENESWLFAAEKTYEFLRHHLVINERLYHCSTDGIVKHIAVLDDVALMGLAALWLFKATHQDRYLTEAINWVDQAERYFAPPQPGLYYFSATDISDVLFPRQKAQDNATPNGNGILAHVLAQLHLITGQLKYRTNLYHLLQSLPTHDTGDLINSPTLLSALDWELEALQIVIIRAEIKAKDTADSLVKIIHKKAKGLYVLSVLDANSTVHLENPAIDKPSKADQTTVYICRGQTCLHAITQQQDLINALQCP